MSFGEVFANTAVLLHHGCAHFIKQFFKFSTVFEGFLDGRHQGKGHIAAVAAALLGEGEQPGRMLIPARTRRAVFPNAGFIDFGQRAFEGRPKGVELSLVDLSCGQRRFHCMYVL